MGTLDKVMAHPWLSPVDSVDAVDSSESAPSSPTTSAHVLSRSAPRPKFALRCTWHAKAQRWGQGLQGPSQEGQAPMLVDLVRPTCLWWPALSSGPRATTTTTTTPLAHARCRSERS